MKSEQVEQRCRDSFSLAKSTKYDGLTKYDLEKALQFFGFAPTNDELNDAFENYSNDGVVILDKYRDLVHKMLPQLVTPGDVLSKLRRFDVVDKGYIPVSELREILCLSSSQKGHGRNDLIDNSKEGLTYDEFLSFVKKVQKPGSPEGDGRVEYSPIVSLLTQSAPNLKTNK
eukprot:gnl/Chilomastix_caulleri/2454.p1 GENE.gnl/Chilomastix_caulleri/2454~~gnl/Chilomastix_caulleri/2454.p1  ORF type:complete len:172 (+),score=28.06 gnl/Chilomastix_caulleri/2454:3-518(+)